jgi:hypothetical protein
MYMYTGLLMPEDGIHTAESLVPQPSISEVETAT